MGRSINLRRRAVGVTLRARASQHERLRSVATMLGRTGASLQLQVPGADGLVLPAELRKGLRAMVDDLLVSDAVVVAPADEEISTEDAAAILNVSRPYVVKLLEEQKIPSRKVGVRRRVLRRDVEAYAEQERRRRDQILTKMVEEAEEDGLDEGLNVSFRQLAATRTGTRRRR